MGFLSLLIDLQKSAIISNHSNSDHFNILVAIVKESSLKYIIRRQFSIHVVSLAVFS